MNRLPYESEFTEGARVTIHLTNGETHYALFSGANPSAINVDTITDLEEGDTPWGNDIEHDTVTRVYPWANILWIEYWGHEPASDKEATS
jgi:hypothetical protein